MFWVLASTRGYSTTGRVYATWLMYRTASLRSSSRVMRHGSPPCMHKRTSDWLAASTDIKNVHLSNYHRYSEEGECWEAPSNCKKARHWPSSDQLLASPISCSSSSAKFQMDVLNILCRLSIIGPPSTTTSGLFTAFVALLCCIGLHRLVAMLDGRCAAVAGSVFSCLAQELLDLCCHFPPGPIAGIGSLGLLCSTRCVHGASRRYFYSLFWLFHFKCQDDKRGLCWGSWLLVSGF